VSDSQVEMIPLAHASAAEIARTLAQLNDNKAADATGDGAKVFADQRTNSLLLSGGKSGRLRMRALIAHLDTPLASGGDTNVVYVHYANAKDMVPILQGIASTLTGEGAQAAAASAAGAIAPPPIAANGASSNGKASGMATILAHEDTNSLIISAPTGMLTLSRPPKVKGATAPCAVSMVLPPLLIATLAGPIRSGSVPNSLVKTTRMREPPRETCTISRRVISLEP